jgi:lipid A 3-O-deacylase
MRGPHFGVARPVGLALLLMIATASAPAFAQSSGIVDQVKVGVLAHDVGVFGDSVERGAQINGEVLFTSPDVLKVIGSPRPTLGAAWNTAGKTSYAYFDMTWTPMLWENLLQSGDGIYGGGFLGGAVHDGNLNVETHGKKALGTRALFHLGLEAGYQITPAYSVEGYFAHLSNADASSHNAGLNDIGIRAGFKF